MSRRATAEAPPGRMGSGGDIEPAEAALTSLRACRELTPHGAGRRRVAAVLQDLEARTD